MCVCVRVRTHESMCAPTHCCLYFSCLRHFLGINLFWCHKGRALTPSLILMASPLKSSFDFVLSFVLFFCNLNDLEKFSKFSLLKKIRQRQQDRTCGLTDSLPGLLFQWSKPSSAFFCYAQTLRLQNSLILNREEIWAKSHSYCYILLNFAGDSSFQRGLGYDVTRLR